MYLYTLMVIAGDLKREGVGVGDDAKQRSRHFIHATAKDIPNLIMVIVAIWIAIYFAVLTGYQVLLENETNRTNESGLIIQTLEPAITTSRL